MDQPVPIPQGAAITLEERPSARTKPRGRVLIVEDEPGLAEVLSLHLIAAGFETGVCHDGLAALYELERESPSLVLLDLHLPQVSGFRLIQLLKQRADTPRVPVMVITALSFPEAEEAVRAGADDFITKPFLPDEVVTRVERLLERVR
jgi:DNA-binding response OmpR family regulator